MLSGVTQALGVRMVGGAALHPLLRHHKLYHQFRHCRSALYKSPDSSLFRLFHSLPSSPRDILSSFSCGSLSPRSPLSYPSTIRAMSTIDSPPFKAQSPENVTEVINKLRTATQKGKNKKSKSYSCKKSTYDIAGSELAVESWKFGDWDYKKFDLPTYARGLFTYHNPVTSHDEIIIRGYDKFFNINEVGQTKWSWIEENTKGPYELTVKENGCIIFISGLPDGTLLVCSKHSTGIREDVEQSHAAIGEKWVDKQLQRVGKTRKDLAKALRDANATAVAELCDDSFEEHILAYEGDAAGLYIHGINLNLPEFATYSAAEAKEFADTWGFKMVDFFEKDDPKILRKLLEEAAETGSWDGKDIEGFVIRCKARNSPTDATWHDWFFKYKFEEPYLMYRQWRECTKTMISGKEPKIRKHKSITKEYLTFAARYFKAHPGAAEKYQENHGIIKVRNAFLEERGLRGSDIIKQESEQQTESDGDVTRDVVLVPIATIGCGKTTVAVALTKLFGWGHVQSDNIRGKGNRGPRFASEVSKELLKMSVVIADRNNHMKREREQLFANVSSAHPDTRFIALHYFHGDSGMSSSSVNLVKQRVRTVTQDRVFSRGDNHQTIQAASMSRPGIQAIMDGFLDRFEPLDTKTSPDSTFDSHIDLDPNDDSRANLETIVNTIKDRYPELIKELPTSEEYDEAIKAAMSNYTVDMKHSVGRAPKLRDQDKRNSRPAQVNSPKKKEIEYFSISVPATTISPIIDEAFKSFESRSGQTSHFYNQLRASNRVQNAFHVTLIHRANSAANQEVWGSYQQKLVGVDDPKNMGIAKVVLDKIVWNGRTMAITVKLDEETKSTNAINHITIGTASKTIPPKESNGMLAQMEDSGKVEMLDLPGEMVVSGVLQAVEARH